MTRSILTAARGRAGTTLFVALAVLLGVLAQQQSLAAPVGLGAKTEITDLQPVQANGLVLAHHKSYGHKKHYYKKHHYSGGHKKKFFKRGHKKQVYKHGHGRKHGFKKYRHGRGFKKFHHGRGFKKFKHGRGFKKFGFRRRH